MSSFGTLFGNEKFPKVKTSQSHHYLTTLTSVLETKFGQSSDLFGMNFGCLEASTGKLHVSENSAESSMRAGWKST